MALMLFSLAFPVLRMILPNCSGAIKRPSALMVNWKFCPGGTGSWPIWPAATWMFCSRNALTTSLALMLRVASSSGSSQARIL